MKREELNRIIDEAFREAENLAARIKELHARNEQAGTDRYRILLNEIDSLRGEWIRAVERYTQAYQDLIKLNG